MIVKFRKVKDLTKYGYYLHSKKSHPEEIIDFNFWQKFNSLKKTISKYHGNKRGQRSKPVSIVVSFPSNTAKEIVIKKTNTLFFQFYKFVNEEHKLGLNDEEIKNLIKAIPRVIHNKPSNPHFHLYLPRIIKSGTTNELISINFSKKKYLNKLLEVSGWGTQTPEPTKQKENRASLYNHKSKQLDEQRQEIQQELLLYKNLNDKLDKYIELVENDLEKGHTQKATKKLIKIKKQNLKPRR